MKTTNTLINRPKDFVAFINADDMKKRIIDRLGGDIQAALRLITTISAAVAGNQKLQECDYETIVNAALTGEVGMNLSLALGEYGIIPYGGIAKYQLQVNGLKQLCIRSKAYSNIDCYDVRKGEFKGRDPRTRAPIFEWIEDEDKRLELPIVGYYAFYVLNDDFNNFFRCLYWSHEKIMRHADRYAPGFSLDKYRQLLEGKLSADEVVKLQGTKNKKGSSPWYANPDDEPHIKMCMKTVLKQLLNDGLAPKSIQEAIADDDMTDAEMREYDLNTAKMTLVESTGEVVEAAESVEEAPIPTDTEKKTKTRQRAKEPAESANDEVENSFFGEGE